MRCSADSTISIDNETVARVYADSGLPANQLVGPYDEGANGTTWSLTRPPYLRDLRAETQVEYRKVSMGARTINGDKFDAYIPTFSIPAGNIQEWEIKGATNHPFHQHVYHVQMNGSCGSDGAFEDGEYYDTVAGSCLVRFDLNPATSSVYDGTTIMHCHILLHEDEGAMGWSDVIGGFSPPDFPDPGHQALYQCEDCTPTEPTELSCNDGLDNDCDGLFDGNDPDCQPVDCSEYTTRQECGDEPTNTCKWNNKKEMCVPR